MRQNRLPGLAALLATLGFTVGLLLALSCGGRKDTSAIQYYGYYHPAGWQDVHARQALDGLDRCLVCHEMTVLHAGNGVPGCMASDCHHKATPGFALPGVHGVRAKMAKDATGGGFATCQMCHGQDFSGGGSGTACAPCHASAAPHPAKPWRSAARDHGSTDPSNAGICFSCHDGTHGQNPNNPPGQPFTPAPAGTTPGCSNATLCHGSNYASHPVPFLAGQSDSLLNGHLTVTAAAFAADCASCHAYAGAPPLTGAPLCSVCHKVADPTAPGTQAGTCLSCHAGASGLPSGPGGTSFPSVAGAHAKHMALATGLTCDTCHAGSGPGTRAHYDNANARLASPPQGPAPVAIDAVYAPKTGGAPAFSPTLLTCAAVSCHGAQTTPNWQSGLLDSATQCTACHAVAATFGLATQYNDAFGRHSKGSHNAADPANAIACTTCHTMDNGSTGALAHFKYLNTHAVDGVSNGTPADQMPSTTIVFDPAIVSGNRTYAATASTQGNGGCTLTCHTHVHTPAFDTWTATGAPHPVPFLAGQVDAQSNGHLSLASTAFNADCAACHAISGTSPVAEAPLCGTCHAIGNPIASGTGAGTCLSCHSGPSGLPKGPAGAAYPSIAGAHDKHMSLLTPITCDTCHTGSGTTTLTHYTNASALPAPPAAPVSVAIAATYNAQSGGSAAFNPSLLTCATVSCHGGRPTPNWQTGSITSSIQCAACHAINSGTSSSQYNDAIGRHAWGTHYNAASSDCALCHDMGSTNTSGGVVNHFKYLDTPAVSGVKTGTPADQMPSGTIRFKTTDATYPITGPATYTINATYPEGDGGCALTCHNQNHDPTVNHWDAPKGSGVAHPVPFYTTDVSTAGNHHQTLTPAQFTAECALCHDETGTSAKTGPVCTVCHTLGSPVAAGKLAGTCLSCHVGASMTIQGPTGAAWPSLQGAHPKHLGLPTFTRSSPALPASLTASAYPRCEGCHVGSVPGDSAQTHYSNANKRIASPLTSGPSSVGIAVTFNAKALTAIVNGTTRGTATLTCGNVSCHGGQTTPVWQNQTLTVNATTYCLKCHAVGAAQFNAPGNLRHGDPDEHRVSCDTCHDMVTGHVNDGRGGTPSVAMHFKYLDYQSNAGYRSATSPDQFPSDTIVFNATATGSLVYTVNATYKEGDGGCALSCHGTTHTNAENHWRKP